MHPHDQSRLVTLGENLAALVETGALLAMAVGGLAGRVIGAPFREPAKGCGCGGRAAGCCYEPPVYRCGGC
jgi:hypothetical protein